MTRNLIALGIAVALLTGCEKPKKAKPTANEQAPVASAPAGGGAGLGGGGGGGALTGALAAAKRLVEANDMKNIHLFIETDSLTNGKMPSANETYAAIKMASKELAAKIDDGTITLCSPKSREEIWAYETSALEKGGWVCSGSGPEKMDAATLKQRLGK